MEEPAAESYHCPNCGDIVDAAGERLIQCPHCGEQFFTPDPHAADQGGEDAAENQKEADREAELSELRIRQVSDLRRGAYRSRSWCIIAAVACVVCAGQLVQMTVHSIRRGHLAIPIGFCLAALASLMGCGYFVARAVELTREIRQSSIPDPPEPPEFSALGNGTQHLKGLDEMSGADR